MPLWSVTRPRHPRTSPAFLCTGTRARSAPSECAVTPLRPPALLVVGAISALCGCGSIGVSGHCRNLPPVPKIGASGVVTASPLPDISGYRVRFHNRDWQAGGLAAHPTPFVGTGVVISGLARANPTRHCADRSGDRPSDAPARVRVGARTTGWSILSP